MPNIPTPDAATPIVNEQGVMAEHFQRWVTQMTDLDLIVGNGSPEGVIEANINREYIDQTGLTGAVKYVKQLPDIAGDKSLGWIAV